MSEILANQVSMYAHGMDKDDIERFKDRLDVIFDIINSSDDIKKDKVNGVATYSQKTTPEQGNDPSNAVPVTESVSVSIVEMSSCPYPLIHFDVRFSDDTANFQLTEVVRQGVRKVDVFNYDDVLDVLDRINENANYIFTAKGMIGGDILRFVEQAEANAARLLNAVIHDGFVLGPNEVCSVMILPNSPYGPARFDYLSSDKRFKFLTDQMSQFLTGLMPKIIKIQYSARESHTHYWLTPLCEIPFEVSAKTIPSDDVIRIIGDQIKDLKGPYMLDIPEPI